MSSIRPSLGALFILIVGCGKSDDHNPPVTPVSADDSEMNAAIEQSRQTVDQFIAALSRPASNQESFSVKARFEEGGKIEHIWVVELRYEGEKFLGELGNVPKDLKKIRLGMPVTVPRREISDWMYLEDGRVVGGFTMRVLRKRMSPAEAREFDQQVRFKE